MLSAAICSRHCSSLQRINRPWRLVTHMSKLKGSGSRHMTSWCCCPGHLPGRGARPGELPGHRVEFVNNSGQPEPVRPFRVTFKAAGRGRLTTSSAPLCICIGVLSAEKMGHEVARTEYLLAAIRLVPASHLCLPYSGCMRRNCFPKPTSLFGEMATARLSVTPYFFVAPQPKKRKKGEAAAAEAAPALPEAAGGVVHAPGPGALPAEPAAAEHGALHAGAGGGHQVRGAAGADHGGRAARCAFVRQ